MTAPPTDEFAPDDPPPPPAKPGWRAFAAAPLVPPAAAAVLGSCLDRYLAAPLFAGFAAALAGVAAWLYFRGKSQRILGVSALAFGLAAAHHHTHRHAFAADDVGEFATSTPVVAKVRGVLEDPPVVRKSQKSEMFGPLRRSDRATAVVLVREIHSESGWRPASGNLRLAVDRTVADGEPGFLDAVRAGDEVEVVGRLSTPPPPGNPGEFDYASYLLDRRIRAELHVSRGDAGVVRVAAAGRSFGAAVAGIRGSLTHALDAAFPPREAGLARALLLGDGTALDRDEWDAFARTGVVHVLAISGQHLVVLAGFVWVSLRFFDVRRRRGAVVVMLLIVAYAVLTGLRPSAVRATVMVCAVCGGLLVRRPVSAANAFALAAIVVVILDPTDWFSAGCQLSFLAVFVLIWGVSPYLVERRKPPLEQLIDESRTPAVRVLRGMLRTVLAAYAVSIALTAATAPLVAARTNIVPPVGAVVGPSLVALTSIALLAGFAAMLVALASPAFAWPFAAVAGSSLYACGWLVERADAVPSGSVFAPGPSTAWLMVFHALLAVVVLFPGTWRKRSGVALAAWLLAGLVGLPAGRSDELRVTFLAVGHGGCTVLETPDGRVLVYDAGSMSGSDAVRRVVAPYLWSRGITRIDELFLSHADLDHFNGVSELLRRFPLGKATLTPSFATKPTAEVAEVLLALNKHNVPRRIAVAGDVFTAGGVELEVLHPPPVGPAGSENERSLVLRVTHAGHAILLTGDLEKVGTARVTALPPRPIDVLVAPHHGSRAAFPATATWANAKFVVVSRGPRDSAAVAAKDAPNNAPIWDTLTRGAVTVTSNPTGVVAESFATGERVVVRRGR